MERSRSQATPLRGAVSRPKRLHREVEQKRRMRVAEQITLLRRALCDTQAEKSDTVSVLQRAVHFVSVAQSTIATLQAENEALRRERARVVGVEWSGAPVGSAASVADGLQRDVVSNDPCFPTAQSSTVMQSAHDCCFPSSSRTATPWTHAQNGVTYDRGAHFAPPPSSSHASLPHFDMVRQYPQQPTHHAQQQRFVPGRAPLPYTTSPEVVTHAAHMPPSAAQRTVAPVETRQSQPPPHSSPPLSRTQPLNVPSRSYDVKPVVSTPRDLSNT